jgi:hypothetical protein
MKNINKFSKLAVLFTAVYFLVASFMTSSIYTLEFSIKWLPNFNVGGLGIFGLFLIALIITSIVLGIISIVKVFKNVGVERWLIIILTVFNIIMLIQSFSALIKE